MYGIIADTFIVLISSQIHEQELHDKVNCGRAGGNIVGGRQSDSCVILRIRYQTYATTAPISNVKVKKKKIAPACVAGFTQLIVVKVAIKCVCFWYSPISFRNKIIVF